MSHITEFEHLKIKLEAIKSATNDFATENCIGKGGFGNVYKGEIVHSKGESMVAFKRLDRAFGQGNPEFWKEITMLFQYKHENLVLLLGFCDESNEKILVYNYACNRSLDFHLNNNDLSWTQRLKICLGIARGLAYLHSYEGGQVRVLHRDIKSSNILLNENWNAKISDFGLSKFAHANRFTFLFTSVVGTVGYCDPLYAETGLLTKESDVYSLGVVLFEVLCGRLCISNKDDRPLTILARQCYELNKLDTIIFGNIRDEIDPNSLRAFTKIAYQCLKRDREERPLITDVVIMLEMALGYQMHANRGPVAKNEAPPRILPISALNPYQGRWTIKTRVTSKGELRRYNNAKGDGKVFSFDLLDSEGGEIRATCFNTIADNFHNQIEVGKVYYLSKGTLKPAQKAFNHLNNEFEITLDHTSTAQPCSDDDVSIPRQQFHFRSIKEIEEMETNSVLDVIAVVTNVNLAMTITRKNGGEAQKRSLYLKDMSGRSVELTLRGDFCNKEGQTLQETVDSGTFPILAVKSARVYEFNGKTLSTISSSQVSINPDFPEAQKLRTWFDSVGKNIPSVSMSREITTHTDNWKTISQIKDEKLGTNEKPDYITIKATIMLMKLETFCYTACPINLGERKCSKKVVDNGDGKWRCDKCDKVVDECDYRYIMQLQIYDHTGMTWITAFQETGEEIIGISAKDLYHMKYVENDEEGFTEVVRGLLHNEYSFKLKVKEESWGEEQRVKSSVVKAEKVKFGSFTKMRLMELEKVKETPDRTAPSGVGRSVGVPSGIGNGNWTRDCPVGY